LTGLFFVGGGRPFEETHAEGGEGDDQTYEFHAHAGEELIFAGGEIGDQARRVFVRRVKNITGKRDVREDRRHRDQHAEEVDHAHAVRQRWERPRWAQHGPPIQ
jgi:hypothetical protein